MSRFEKIKKNTEGLNVLALEKGDLQFLIEAYEELEKKFREVFGPAGFKSVSKLMEERDEQEKRAEGNFQCLEQAIKERDELWERSREYKNEWESTIYREACLKEERDQLRAELDEQKKINLIEYSGVIEKLRAQLKLAHAEIERLRGQK